MGQGAAWFAVEGQSTTPLGPGELATTAPADKVHAFTFGGRPVRFLMPSPMSNSRTFLGSSSQAE